MKIIIDCSNCDNDLELRNDSCDEGEVILSVAPCKYCFNEVMAENEINDLKNRLHKVRLAFEREENFNKILTKQLSEHLERYKKITGEI